MYRKIEDKRAKLSQRMIYEALSDIVERKSFEDITITEVVEKAQVARSTFYRNFDNLHDVLKMASDRAFQGLYGYIIEYYENAKREESKVINFVKPFLEYWYEDSEIIELLIKSRSFDLLLQTLAETIEKLLNVFNPKEGVITEYKNYYIAIRTSLSISILIEWIRNGKDIPPEELALILNKQVEESIKQRILI
ncbi:MAG: TetR/AcrR family transcriptional regulator [Clostridia bacterium]